MIRIHYFAISYVIKMAQFLGQVEFFLLVALPSCDGNLTSWASCDSIPLRCRQHRRQRRLRRRNRRRHIRRHPGMFKTGFYQRI